MLRKKADQVIGCIVNERVINLNFTKNNLYGFIKVKKGITLTTPGELNVWQFKVYTTANS